MSTVLICRDALEDAVLGNIALARAMAQRGDEVALVFTGEALAALDKGTFRWSPNFKTRDARSAAIAAAEANGLPLAAAVIQPTVREAGGSRIGPAAVTLSPESTQRSPNRGEE